jgi:hypothetical protein
MIEGPPLQQLTHRLSECPPEFLLPPLERGSGVVHVEAVVFDTLREIGGASTLPARADVTCFEHTVAENENWLRAVLIACWLLGDEYFRKEPKFLMTAREWLRGGLQEVCEVVDAPNFVSDADRREELARLCLKALQLNPQGEREAAAQDRLTTLNSIERQRVLKATQAAQQRANEIREAMRKKAAEESAAKYTRE